MKILYVLISILLFLNKVQSQYAFGNIQNFGNYIHIFVINVDSSLSKQVFINDYDITSYCPFQLSAGGNEYFRCSDLPIVDQIKSGTFKIIVNGITITKDYSLAPVISTVTYIDSPTPRLPTTGGYVALTGRYFDLNKYDGTTNDFQLIYRRQTLSPTVYIINNSSSITVLIPDGTGYTPGNIDNPLYARSATNTTEIPKNIAYESSKITKSTFDESNSYITIDGSNFGAYSNLIKVYACGIIISGGEIQLTVPHYQVLVYYDSAAFNYLSCAYYQLNVNNVNSSSAILAIPSHIYSVSTPPSLGGQITIVGSFLNNVSASGDPIYWRIYMNSVSYSSTICSFLNGTTAICDSPSRGSNAKLSVYLEIGNQKYTETIDAPYLTQQIYSASKLTYGQPGLVTIKGDNFFQGAISVSIGGKECTTPQLIDSSTIICTFSADVISSTSGLMVSVSTINGVSNESVFQYYSFIQISNRELLEQSYPDINNECSIKLKAVVSYSENSFPSYYNSKRTEIKMGLLLYSTNKTSSTVMFILKVPISNPPFDIVVSGSNITETTFYNQLDSLFTCIGIPNNIKINNILKLPQIQYNNNISNSTLLNIKEIKYWSSLKLNVLDNIPIDIEMQQISSGIFRITYSSLKSPIQIYNSSKSIIDCQIVDLSNSSNIIDLKIDIGDIFKKDSVKLTTDIKSIQIISSPENHFLIKSSSSSAIGSVYQQLLVSNVNSFISSTVSNETSPELDYKLNNYFKPVYGSNNSGNNNSIFISRINLYQFKKYGYLLYNGNQSKTIETFVSNQDLTTIVQYYDSSIIKFIVNSYNSTEPFSRYNDSSIEFTLFNQIYQFQNVLPLYFKYITTQSVSNIFNVQFPKPVFLKNKEYYLSEFPINFINGSLVNFNYNVVVFCSRYSANQISIINNINNQDYFVNLIPKLILNENRDGFLDRGLFLTDFQKIPILSNMNMILRLKINSTVGIGIIKINNLEYSAASVLTEGNLKVGYFEILYDYTLNPNPEIILIDNSFRSIKLIDNYGYLYLTPIPPNPVSVSYTILDLIYFKFSTKSIDLSSKSSNITLYLNFTNPNPNYSPLLYLDISDNTNNNKSIIGKWDPLIQLYRIDFILPARLYSGNLNYRLNITNTYNTEEIASFIGDNAYLSIISDYSDQMPPLIKEIKQINNDTHFGWLLTIEELVNGFKSGYIKVIGDYDYLGYNFNFTNNDLVNGDQFSLIIKKEYFTNNKYCRNQNYTISIIRLEDQSGFYSFTNMLPVNYDLDPLMYIQDHSKLTIKINCMDPQDNKVPTFISNEIVSNDFNPFSGNRNLIFKYTCFDESGISNKNYPIVQLVNVYNERLVCNSVFVEYSNSTHSQFTCSMTTPYGYGYPVGIQLSLFGITDNHFNFNSKLDFGFINTTNSLEASINKTPPIILSNQNYFYGSTNLIIYGRNFGLNNDSSVYNVNLYNNNNRIINLNNSLKINYISSTALAIENIPASISTLSRFIIQLEINNKLSNNFTITPINNSDNQEGNNNNNGSGSSSELFCLNSCSGNGECIDKVCICYDQYIGTSCESKIVTIKPPKINTKNPESSIEYDGDQVLEQSIISIIGMNEVTITGEVVKNHTFKTWVYTNITNETGRLSSLYTTYLYYNNINTTINVKVEWFNETLDYSFAGTTLTMLPSSVKYTISMNTYGFLNQLNSLQLLMYTNTLTNKNSKICKTSQSFSDSSNDISQFLQIQINDHNLIGRFIKRGLIDGLVTSILNTYIHNSDTSLASTVAINIPNFKYNIVIDPDYSTLVTSNLNTCDDNSGLTTNQLIGIIIGSVGFFIALIIILGFIMYKKLKYNSTLLALKDKLKYKNNNIGLKEL